jgi:hypothetical protein
MSNPNLSWNCKMNPTDFFVICGRYIGSDFWRFSEPVVIKSVNKDKDSIHIVGIDSGINLVTDRIIRYDQITDFRAGHLPDRLMATFNPHLGDLTFPDSSSADIYIEQNLRKK